MHEVTVTFEVTNEAWDVLEETALAFGHGEGAADLIDTVMVPYARAYIDALADGLKLREKLQQDRDCEGDCDRESMEEPEVGEIVLYYLTDGDVEAIERRRVQGVGHVQHWPPGAQAHVGNPVTVGQMVPAIVVDPMDNGAFNGQGFLDGNDVLWLTSVPYAETPTPGHWNRGTTLPTSSGSETVHLEQESDGGTYPRYDNGGNPGTLPK